MAAVSVDESNNRLDGAEATTNWTKITQAVAQEPDFKYQGTYSVSGKIGTSSAGHYLSLGASVDMTAGDDLVCMFKGIWTNKDVLQSVPAAEHRIGSGTGAYYFYYIADDGTQGDIDYPAKGGWLISPINPNEAAWRDGVVGSPALASANYWATLGRFTATSKAENVATDAVDLSDGLYLVGGDGGGFADGTFQDFVDDDEGDLTNGRFGHVSTLEGVITVFGKLVIGRTAGATVTATEFTDTLRTLVFPGGRVAPGWNELEFDLGNASTIVTLNNVAAEGTKRWDSLERYFDTEYEVDGTNDEVDIIAHGFETGDYILYSDEGGTETMGLTDGSNYWVRRVSADAISFHTTRQNAYTNTSKVNLTASTATNGEHHSIKRAQDVRPDFTMVSASGSFDAIACTLVNFRTITFTSAGTFTGCTLVGCTGVTLSTGALDGCTIASALLGLGESLITVATLVNITDCAFTAGDCGHAINITAAGVYTFDGNIFSGYGPTHKEFHTTDDIDDGNDEIDITAHGFSTGDPIYYSDEGGVQNIGLTDQALYFVRAVTVDALSIHPTKYAADNNQNKIALTAGGSETHAIYSANAAIYNSSGGSVTINLTGAAATIPTIRNGAGGSVTILNAKTVKVTAKDASTLGTITGARVLLLAAAAGDLPHDVTVTITRSGTVATVSHTGHGFGVGDKVQILGADQPEYNGVRTITTVPGANSYTYTVSGTPDTPATGTILATAVILDGTTDGGGVVQDTAFNYTSDQPVDGWVRKGTSTPLYKSSIISGTITDTGFTVEVFLVTDE